MRREIEIPLERGAKAVLDRALTAAERDAFHKYLTLLLKWQEKHRLLGSSDPRWIIDNLFVGSLLFLRVLPASSRTLLDLGAGAGFPGLPLKIVRDELDLTLVESRRRRASFLAMAVREMSLQRVRVVNDRAEELVKEYASRFDAVVMRCAGSPAALFPVALTLVRPGGLVAASGPPEPATAPPGAEAVRVPGALPGSRRTFIIARRP